jgi:hypothetical protein
LRSLTPHEFQQYLPHPLVVGEDKANGMFMAGTMPKESFALKVDFDDDINNFLTLTNISRSRAIAPHKE